MSAAARDLACHLARQVRHNPRLAYHIGPGSRTWELLCDAIASITGETPETVQARLRDGLETER